MLAFLKTVFISHPLCVNFSRFSQQIRVLCQVIWPVTSGAEQKQAAPACNVTSNITCNRDCSSTVTPSPSSVQPALSNSSFHNQQRVGTRAAVHLAGQGSGTAPLPQIAPVQPPYKQRKAWGMRGITWTFSLG